MVKNFTKKNLAEQIHKKVGFSKNFSSVLIDDFIDILKDELINSQKVKACIVKKPFFDPKKKIVKN